MAWPQTGDVGRGVKIPCKGETSWAHIVADAEDCATFAYLTLKCFETSYVKCRGTLRAWQNESKMLVTEISPSRSEGQPPHITSNVVDPAPAATIATVSTTQWQLEDKKIYYVKKPASLLRVKVERPSPASHDVTHLVVINSRIPQKLWKGWFASIESQRNYHIRERQATRDPAESVIVRVG